VSLISRLLDAYNALTQPRDPRRLYRYWLQPTNPAGVRITHQNALQISAVYACVDVISKSIASSQWNVFELMKSGNRTLLADDPISYLLNVRPNSDMPAVNFREALMIMALTWGNGYAEIARDMAGRPVALYPLSPDRVEPWRDIGGPLYYKVFNEDGNVSEIEQSDIIHVKGPSLNGLVGDNLVAKAALSLGLTMATERYAATYFGNNTEVGGMLKVPGNLDDKAYDRLVNALEKRHRGPNNAFRPFIGEGGAEYVQTISNAEDAQLVAARQNQVEEVCRWFGVPPHKIAHLLRSTNNNIEQQGMEFTRDALTPWCKRNQQEFDYKLFSARGKNRFSRIDIEWLSQGDAIARSTYYQTMRNIGVYSVNDILKFEGRDTIGPEGDIRIVNSASTRLEDVGANLPDANPADDTNPTPPIPDKNNPDEQINNALTTCFEQVFSRFSSRLSNRLKDYDTVRHTSEERAKFIQDFKLEQTRMLHESLCKPAQILSLASGRETFGAALAQGQAVVEGADPGRAAHELVSNFLKRAA